MNSELMELLEARLEKLIEGYTALKQEAFLLREENDRLLEERNGFRSRIDCIIKKMEGI